MVKWPTAIKIVVGHLAIFTVKCRNDSSIYKKPFWLSC